MLPAAVKLGESGRRRRRSVAVSCGLENVAGGWLIDDGARGRTTDMGALGGPRGPCDVQKRLAAYRRGNCRWQRLAGRIMTSPIPNLSCSRNHAADDVAWSATNDETKRGLIQLLAVPRAVRALARARAIDEDSPVARSPSVPISSPRQKDLRLTS
jgi:hypothetical protein